MGIRDEIARLRQLNERIATTRAELIALRDERDALRRTILATRDELENPLRGLDVEIVYDKSDNDPADVRVDFAPVQDGRRRRV